MSDLVFFAGIALFAILTWCLITLSDRLSGGIT